MIFSDDLTIAEELGSACARTLRSVANGRRSLPGYFDDLKGLMQEADHAGELRALDDAVIGLHKAPYTLIGSEFPSGFDTGADETTMRLLYKLDGMHPARPQAHRQDGPSCLRRPGESIVIAAGGWATLLDSPRMTGGKWVCPACGSDWIYEQPNPNSRRLPAGEIDFNETGEPLNATSTEPILTCADCQAPVTAPMKEDDNG